MCIWAPLYNFSARHSRSASAKPNVPGRSRKDSSWSTDLYIFSRSALCHYTQWLLLHFIFCWPLKYIPIVEEVRPVLLCEHDLMERLYDLHQPYVNFEQLLSHGELMGLNNAFEVKLSCVLVFQSESLHVANSAASPEASSPSSVPLKTLVSLQ